jgi:hypothetical protein
MELHVTFPVNFSCTWNGIFISEHVLLNNMLISWPCLTLIYKYPYVYVFGTGMFSLLCKNFIGDSAKPF